MRKNLEHYGQYADTNRISVWLKAFPSAVEDRAQFAMVMPKNEAFSSTPQRMLFYDRRTEERLKILEDEVKELNQMMIKHLQIHNSDMSDDLVLTMFASETVLSKDWNSPEEDEAWADL
ncbi:MAG: hypothetical protein AB2L12_07615 [Smithellaceae bacterium]